MESKDEGRWALLPIRIRCGGYIRQTLRGAIACVFWGLDTLVCPKGVDMGFTGCCSGQNSTRRVLSGRHCLRRCAHIRAVCSREIATSHLDGQEGREGSAIRPSLQPVRRQVTRREQAGRPRVSGRENSDRISLMPSTQDCCKRTSGSGPRSFLRGGYDRRCAGEVHP